MCANLVAENQDLKSVGVDTLPQDDVVDHSNARASPSPTESATSEQAAKTNDAVVPAKKRKTRRGKSKRRNAHPYTKNYRKSNKVIKPEAPHNSNQFLLEDHGNIEELDQKLKCNDQASVSRTRDSSFSVDTIDSEGEEEFYSSPDDEKEFLIKDFDDQYETLHAERLYSMSKNELIQEYLSLEAKVEQLTNRLMNNRNNDSNSSEIPVNIKLDLQSEVERLTLENERLRQENSELKNKISLTCTSDSEDSETDSSDSCSSVSSSLSETSESPIDYTQTNGH